MFVHYSTETPRQFLGATHTEMPGEINIPVTEEEYCAWIMNPCLDQKYNLLQVDGEWKLITIMERKTLPDLELVPTKSDDAVDVMLALDPKGVAYVHVFNQQMANDPTCKTFFYGVEANDALSAVFDLEASGVDTQKDVEFDPQNVQVWVRDPIDTIKYGLKIL